MAKGEQKKKNKVPRVANPSSLASGSGAPVAENDLITVVMNEITLYQFPDTDGTGTFVHYAGSSPANSSSWNGYADVYKEYRTVSMEVSYVPAYAGAAHPSNTTGSIGFTDANYSVVDHTNDSLTSLTLTAAKGYETLEVRPCNMPYKRRAKMMGVEESVFTETASAANLYGIAIVQPYISNATTLSTATVAFTVYVRRTVQFRVRDTGVLASKDAKIRELEEKLEQVVSITKQKWGDMVK